MADRRGPHLILASASPRRRQLLEDAGFAFDVVPPEIDETPGLCSNCGPADMVMQIARDKAADVQRRVTQCPYPHPTDSIVVACDTVVECGGRILGKPNDEDHARKMLEMLSGRECRVFSGLCVWPLGAASPKIGFETTTLRIDNLHCGQIESYLESKQWQGKAGAFGYQDGLAWIHIVEGSQSNVVGLPMELLQRMLDEKTAHRSGNTADTPHQ
jgi:septum formation protein